MVSVKEQRVYEVSTESGSYPVIIGSSHLDQIGREINFLGKSISSIFLITDDHIESMYYPPILSSIEAYQIPINHLVLPPGEDAKNLTVATHCWEKMVECGIDRESLVISLGGGVISDLSAFVASCYMRGIDVVHIPTSLMGMVDASIGGKTGVNMRYGKNVIGTFYQPKLIFIDIDTLKSLPARELKAGISEVIKAAFIHDPEFFQFLEDEGEKLHKLDSKTLLETIERAASIKIEIINQDFKDRGVRSALNWGHSFAHALEACTGFQKFLHGEAVAIGMSCSAVLSYLRGDLDELCLNRLEILINRLSSSTKLPSEISDEEIVSMMKKDKKNISGELNCIISNGIGKLCKKERVTEDLVFHSLKTKRERDRC